MFQQTLLDYKEDSLSTPGGINAAAVTCTGTVGAFGSPTFKLIVVIDPDDPIKKEQVRLTASGASFTQMERGFNGTTAQVHSINAPIRMVMPSFEYNKIVQFIEDGWSPVPDYLPITFASTTSFTLQGDWTVTFQAGDKIKLVNGSTKYFYIQALSVAAGVTTILLMQTNDFALVSGSITGLYYSKAMSAVGFPQSFNYTPTLTSSGTAPSVGNGTIAGRYSRSGKNVTYNIIFTGGTTTSFGTGDFHFAIPTTVSPLGIDAVGSARATNPGTSNYILISNAGVNTNYATIWVTAGSLVGSSIPFAWGSGASLALSGTYESA